MLKTVWLTFIGLIDSALFFFVEALFTTPSYVTRIQTFKHYYYRIQTFKHYSNIIIIVFKHSNIVQTLPDRAAITSRPPPGFPIPPNMMKPPDGVQVKMLFWLFL